MNNTLYSLGVMLGNIKELRNKEQFASAVSSILSDLSTDSTNHHFTIGYANGKHILVEEAKKEISDMKI